MAGQTQNGSENGQTQMDNPKWTAPNGQLQMDKIQKLAIPRLNIAMSIWSCPFGIVHLKLSIWDCPFQLAFPEISPSNLQAQKNPVKNFTGF
jgi:hypothetical protein